MSMCRVFSCVVGRGCLLWPVPSLGTTLLAFALLHFVLQGQICLLLQVSLDFLLLHSSLLWWKGHLFWVLILEGLHRVVSLLLLQQFWSVHRLRLPWYWMVCLGNKQRSCCHFRDCTQVLHFRYTAVCLRKLKHGLCINLEGSDGEGDGSEAQEGGSYITYGWLMLRFDRKLQISVKQLWFN